MNIYSSNIDFESDRNRNISEYQKYLNFHGYNIVSFILKTKHSLFNIVIHLVLIRREKVNDPKFNIVNALSTSTDILLTMKGYVL
jgi:hypothetical protein